MVTEGSPYENYIDSIKEIGEKTEEKKSEGAKLEYMVSTFFNNMFLMSAVGQNVPPAAAGKTEPAKETQINKDSDDIELVIEAADHAPAIDSTDYYGIVFIAYISWCAIVGGAGLFTNEKKNCIIERLRK